MFCPDCGAVCPDGIRFCEQCGASLEPGDPSAPVSPAPPAPILDAPPIPPASLPEPPQARPAAADVGWYGTAGIIVALISTFVIPIIFGPLAILLGFIGHSRGDPRGKIAIVLGIVCMLIGFAISYILFSEF